jgi:acyl dehydratase
MKRDLELTADSLVSYSRSGNFHSDPHAAAALGHPGMVAQGMHVAGVVYALLLDAWGEAFLASGEMDLTFVGVVYESQIVTVELEAQDVDAINFEITEKDRTVVVGTARSARSTAM